MAVELKKGWPGWYSIWYSRHFRWSTRVSQFGPGHDTDGMLPRGCAKESTFSCSGSVKTVIPYTSKYLLRTYLDPPGNHPKHLLRRYLEA